MLRLDTLKRVFGKRDLPRNVTEPGTHFLDDAGREIADNTPMAPPIGYQKTPSIVEQIRMMVRSEKLAQEARDAGYETAEEADDFEIGDDYDPTSPYEHDFEPPLPPAAPPEAVRAVSDPKGDMSTKSTKGGPKSAETPSSVTPTPPTADTTPNE